MVIAFPYFNCHTHDFTLAAYQTSLDWLTGKAECMPPM